eukprot:6207651-Pleurochrysis_carterae.AAC.12
MNITKTVKLFIPLNLNLTMLDVLYRHCGPASREPSTYRGIAQASDSQAAEPREGLVKRRGRSLLFY